MPFLRDLRTAIMGRFFPAAMLAVGVIMAPLVALEPRGYSFTSLGVLAVEVVLMSLGYAAAVVTFRRGRHERLPGSYRHAAGGLLAPAGLAATSLFVQGTNLPGIIIVSFAAGAFIGTVLWARSFLAPRPPGPSLEDRERDADAELARVGMQMLPDGKVVPIKREDRERERHRPSEHVA